MTRHPLTTWYTYHNMNDYWSTEPPKESVVHTFEDMAVNPNQPPRYIPDTEPVGATTAVSRDYTMTITEFASLLHRHGIDRDERTLQRWCKAGKIEATHDSSEGDRWLINPKSAELYVKQLVENIKSATAPSDTSRQDEDYSATRRDTETDTSRQSEKQTPTRRDNPEEDQTNTGDDSPDNDATSRDTNADTSRQTEQDDATHGSKDGKTAEDYERKISKLKMELAISNADKKARESVVDYMQEQFEKSMTLAIEVSEKNGRLEAKNQQLLGENEQLRQMLPAAQYEVPNFTPDSMRQDGEETM